jgi:aldehyde dehydrogenase (NAD+)
MFGLTFNGGFTCISPRRLFVDERLRAELESRLTAALRSAPELPLDPAILPRLTRAIETAVDRGARRLDGGTTVESPTRPLILTDVSPRSPLMTEDIGAPVISIAGFSDTTEARGSYDACGFELGVSVFGDIDEASRFADTLRCGVAVINDLIAPTADARLPFGGTGLSGHGVTRGEEGLLELTRPCVRIVRQGKRRRHLEPVGPGESRAIEALLRLTHGRSIGVRVRALIDLVRGASGKSKATQETE